MSNWVAESMKDDDGQYDVAYVALFFVSLAVFVTIPFMCAMSAVAYFRCTPVVKDAVAVVNCAFDPQPLGIAVGAVGGGFATALGALAGYMAATRNQKKEKEKPNA